MKPEKQQMIPASGTAVAAPGEQLERPIAPRYELTENANDYTLRLEMPGVNKDTLEIEVDRERLSVHGRRAESEEGLSLLVRERSRAAYHREFAIDDTVEWEKIHATACNGVVELTIPKASKSKPRKIQIA